DGAIVEHAPKHRLIDVDALDLVHMDLDRAALNEALDIDHPEIGDGDLGGPADEAGAQSEDSGDGEADRSNNPPDRSESCCDNACNREANRHQIRHPAHASLIADRFSRLQDLLDVAQSALPINRGNRWLRPRSLPHKHPSPI